MMEAFVPKAQGKHEQRFNSDTLKASYIAYLTLL
jgi:hypothetical protein